MCVQWFQPELERVTLEDPEDTQTQQSALFFLYAFNNKALNLASNPVPAQVKAGLCHVIDTRAQTLHEKLMVTLETAENDLVATQTSQTVFGTNEQNKGELLNFKKKQHLCLKNKLEWLIKQLIMCSLEICHQFLSSPSS